MPMAAHMFCLIYACLSNITPPVAMSSYVAAGIANSDQTKTSLIAVRLGLVGFVIPFFFLNNPLLLIGSSPDVTTVQTIWAVTTAIIGTIAMVSGLEGWLLGRCNWVERIALLGFSLCLIDPGVGTDTIGFMGLAAVLAFQLFKLAAARKAKKAA
ncbi:hypothetical protein SDC9_198761 [bioreactor metagenome]|uniref:TRAP C4-dicarboxylate transport system permease DctM subunit domain-containing protein n=1 Tax=bioreactor metagenome TaxID=1076179 RepID=A0A645IKX6_9ZZZZ